MRRHDATRQNLAVAGLVGLVAARPGTEVLDHRLIIGETAELREIIADHDVVAGRCPECGWAGKVCPSRVIAQAVKARRAVPDWVAHLVDFVPGAVAPRGAAEPAVEQLGLFEVPRPRTGDRS